MSPTKWFCGILLACSLLGFIGCDLCENETLSIVAAPNGRVNAVLFTRSCGATTGVGTHISVLPAGVTLPNQSGNTFVADSDHGRVPTGTKGELSVQIRWLSNSKLLIIYPEGSRLFHSADVEDDIHIEYRKSTP